MPTSLVGVIIFVVLLAPGVVFAAVREAQFPRRTRSPLRETASVVFTSAVTLIVASSVFGLVRVVTPKRTPDIGLLVRDSHAFAAGSYLSGLFWGLGVLAFACVLAALAARFSPEYPGKISSRSAWVLAFEETRAEGHSIYVGCELHDGTYVGGFLRRYSTEPQETVDRELTLEAPITYAPVDGNEVNLEVNMIVVSAREIKFFSVSFLAQEPPS